MSAAVASPDGLDPALRRGLTSYLRWVANANRDVVLRAVRHDDGDAVCVPLDDAFASLEVALRGEVRREPDVVRSGGPQPPLDLSSLAPLAESVEESEPASGYRTMAAETILGVTPTAVITGGPGSGKTTVLQYLALSLSRLALGTHDDGLHARLGLIGGMPVPILVPLNAYVVFLRDRELSHDARDATVLRFVEDYVVRRQGTLRLPRDFFIELLERGVHLAFMFDGLDEIEHHDDRVRASRAIEDLVQAPYAISVIVTSRGSAYGGEVVLPPNFREFAIAPLSPEAVKGLITSICDSINIAAPTKLHADARALVAAVETLERQRAQLHAEGRLINSPLMVRMLITVHLWGARFVERRGELYAQYVDALLRSTYHWDPAVAQRLATPIDPAGCYSG